MANRRLEEWSRRRRNGPRRRCELMWRKEWIVGFLRKVVVVPPFFGTREAEWNGHSQSCNFGRNRREKVGHHKSIITGRSFPLFPAKKASLPIHEKSHFFFFFSVWVEESPNVFFSPFEWPLQPGQSHSRQRAFFSFIRGLGIVATKDS